MSRFQTGISQRPIFSGGYYGGQGGVDPSLMFQQLARTDPLGASSMARSSLFSSGASDPRQAAWRADAEELQAIERERLAEIERQYQERIRREHEARLLEESRQSDFQRQSQLSAQSARQSQEQMIAQNNLQVFAEAGRGLQARDDRAYRQRHPYLPGQSPGEQQDARHDNFRNEQEWSMAQKRLDQNIRGEDQLQALRRAKQAEGWTYTPEQEELVGALDRQVGVAQQMMTSGKITGRQFQDYLKVIDQKKSELFPTQPPNPEQVNAQFMLGNRAQNPSQSGAGARVGGAGIGPGGLNKFDQEEYSSVINDARRKFQILEEEYSGKGEAPNWGKFLRARISTLPGNLRSLAESQYGFSDANAGGNQGNAEPPELGGPTRPNVGGGGESVPTDMSGGSRKGRFDEASKPNVGQRLRSIEGAFQQFANGTHPYLEKAMQRGNPQEVESIRQRVMDLSAGYYKNKDDESWRELTSVLMNLAKIGQGAPSSNGPSVLTEEEMSAVPRRQGFRLNDKAQETGGVDPDRFGEARPRADIGQVLNQGSSGFRGGQGVQPSNLNEEFEPSGLLEEQVLEVMESGQMSREEAIAYLKSEYLRKRRSR